MVKIDSDQCTYRSNENATNKYNTQTMAKTNKSNAKSNTRCLKKNHPAQTNKWAFLSLLKSTFEERAVTKQTFRREQKCVCIHHLVLI